MLSNKISSSFIKTLPSRYIQLRRNNTSQAVNAAPTYGPSEIQRCELMNGVKIAVAKQFGGLMASCTIMFSSAGSRYESDDTLGVSHFIRNTSDTTGCRYSDFIKIRQLKQTGGSIYCTSDRQSVQFTLRCLLQDFPEFKLFLWDTALKCRYPEHQLTDRKHQLIGELTRMSPEQRVMDLIQTASFTGPLSNSIFCVKERIDAMTHDVVDKFVTTNFRVDECSLGTVGVPYDWVLQFAENIEPHKERDCPRQDVPSLFRNGYEFCDLGKDEDCYIALAIPGCGTRDCNASFHHAIIANACGTDRLVSGQHKTDRTIHPPLGLIDDDIYTDFFAFNVSYRETGIFGVLAKTRPCNAVHVAFSVAEFLKNLGELSEKDIQYGKQRLKLSMAIYEQKHQSKDLAFQMANYVLIDGASAAFGVIDAYPNAEILATAQYLAEKAKTSMSMAAVGDISAIPHDKDIISN